jgi:hypothetical protein
MDPLAFLNNAFSAYNATNVLSVIVSLSGIVVLLLLTLTSGDFWCARICPLGATQDFLENIGSFLGNFRKSNRTESRVKAAPGNAFLATRRMFIAVAAGLGFSLLARKIGQASEMPRWRPARPETFMIPPRCGNAYAPVHPRSFIRCSNPSFDFCCPPSSIRLLQKINAQKGMPRSFKEIEPDEKQIYVL